MSFTAKQQAMIVSALVFAVQEGEEDITAITDTLGGLWAFAVGSNLDLQAHISPEPFQDEPEDIPIYSSGFLRFVLDEVREGHALKVDVLNAELASALTALAAANARLDGISTE